MSRYDETVALCEGHRDLIARVSHRLAVGVGDLESVRAADASTVGFKNQADANHQGLVLSGRNAVRPMRTMRTTRPEKMEEM